MVKVCIEMYYERDVIFVKEMYITCEICIHNIYVSVLKNKVVAKSEADLLK